jgi:radical SAM superfamily enzyme YgiQ (UPF0313 family)
MARETKEDQVVRVMLGDPRHNTLGVHSPYVPVGIGYIGAYLLSHFGREKIEIRTSINPDELLDWIDTWQPNVIGLSSYIWNSQLSYRICEYAKSQLQRTLTVLGGPEFPSGTGQANLEATWEDCCEYLKIRPALDYYCYSDGEAALPLLLDRFLEADGDAEKLRKMNKPVSGFGSLTWDKQELLDGKAVNRIGLKNRVGGRDIIPSPYLTGMLDQYLDGQFVPSWETARGCPFLCAFCDQGLDDTKIVRFSVERVKKELSYVAERVADISGTHSIRFHDSNWGMYREDWELAEHIKTLMDQYDWPKWIEISTPKNRKERILAIDDLLYNRVQVALSQQSMNRDTLREIKRDNYSNKEYLGFVKELQSRGKSPTCELIVPLPGETEDTYRTSVRMLLNEGVTVGTYTLMMLQGAELGRTGARRDFEMQSGFRTLPRDFGEYRGKRIFDVEEICVGTNTLPFDSYLRCRKLSFVVHIFSNRLFDPLRKFCEEVGIEYYQVISDAFHHLEKSLLESDDSVFSEFQTVYCGFAQEAETEIFDDISDLCEFYERDENYAKLLEGEIGDNLLRKYAARALFLAYEPLIDLAIDISEVRFSDEGQNESKLLLQDIRTWLKNFYAVPALFGNNGGSTQPVTTAVVAHDVVEWLGSSDRPLAELRRDCKIEFRNDQQKLNKITGELESLFGQEDRLFAIGKYLHQFGNRSLEDLARQAVVVS